MKFSSVPAMDPDVTLSSSAMDWFVQCSVNDTRNMFLQHVFFNAFCYVFVQESRFTSVRGSWKYACSYYS